MLRFHQFEEDEDQIIAIVSFGSHFLPQFLFLFLFFVFIRAVCLGACEGQQLPADSMAARFDAPLSELIDEDAVVIGSVIGLGYNVPDLEAAALLASDLIECQRPFSLNRRPD